MCKTSLGACFAQRSPDGDHVRYACANWLADEADRRLCLTSAVYDADYVIRRRVTSSRADMVTWTELACCSTDMCNYYYFRSQQVVASVDIHRTNGNPSTSVYNRKSATKLHKVISSNIDVIDFQKTWTLGFWKGT